MYAAVDALEREAGREVACVLHVGDFGVWPDPDHLDDATQKHGEDGSFRRLLRAGRVPRKTIFIAGNHEDFDYLAARSSNELIENLWFLPWGEVTEVRAGVETLRVGGIGGCYGPRDYEKVRVSGWARRHYVEADLERLKARATERLDVLLLHEPPAGTFSELHAPPGFKPRTWTLVGEGQSELVAALRPRVCFTGHLHARTERVIAGVRTVGLNKVAYRGSVLLVEIPAEGEVTVLDEWGGAPSLPARPTEATTPDEEPFDGRALDTLIARLNAWSSEVLGGKTLDRDGRKRVHQALGADPMRAVLMGALTGADLRALLERSGDAATRHALVKEWLARALPTADAMR